MWRCQSVLTHQPLGFCLGTQDRYLDIIAFLFYFSLWQFTFKKVLLSILFLFSPLLPQVCLSILNTWHGRPEEKWNPQTSSFLQVNKFLLQFHLEIKNYLCFEKRNIVTKNIRSKTLKIKSQTDKKCIFNSL